ncbi:MAG: hypothetical protein AAFZ91_14320 [Pseudomonadota bacterium]
MSEQAANPVLKSKRWTLVLSWGVALAPAVFFGVLTGAWLLSSDFKLGTCWLDPGNGTWLTPNEGMMMIIPIVGLGWFLIAVIVLGGMQSSRMISSRMSVASWCAGVIALATIFSINTITNDGYIDRLYTDCAREN